MPIFREVRPAGSDMPACQDVRTSAMIAHFEILGSFQEAPDHGTGGGFLANKDLLYKRVFFLRILSFFFAVSFQNLAALRLLVNLRFF